MKRLAVLAVLAAVFWSVPAFGAESIRVLRNGEEVRLPQGIIRENGTLMMSLEDLAELTVKRTAAGRQRNCAGLPHGGRACRAGIRTNGDIGRRCGV